MKVNDIKINNHSQANDALPVENKGYKAQTSSDDYKAISTNSSYSKFTSGKAMFENMSAPEDAENNNTHGGDVNAALGILGDGTYNTVEAQASDEFAPPDFDEILEKLDKKAYDAKSIETVLARYDAKIEEYLAALKNLEGSMDVGAQVVCRTLKSKMTLWDVERDKVQKHLTECKNIDKKEMSLRRDLNGDGKVWKWREVETVYGTTVLIDDQNRIISNNNFKYTDANGEKSDDMSNFSPKFAGGDLSYIQKNDDGRFVFSMEQLIDKWNAGETGFLDLNIPPAVWVRIDGEGEVITENNQCVPLGIQKEGDDYVQGGEKGNYVLIPVTDVEIQSKHVDGQQADVTDTIIKIKGQVPGEKGFGSATLMEMSIQPCPASDGKMISAAGTPIKLNIADGITWKGPPQVINLDAEAFNPQKYSKIPESMLEGIDLSGVDQEKLGILTGNISGTKYSFNEDEDSAYLKEEKFEIPIEGNATSIVPVSSDSPLRDNGSGMLTTGLVVVDGAAGLRTYGSGDDLTIAKDFGSICEINEKYTPNPGDPEFTRIYDGGYGENMIIGNSGDKEIEGLSFGTLAAKGFTLVDIRGTAVDDMIYATSPDINDGRNYQRRWNIEGECEFFAGAEEEEYGRYEGYESYVNGEWFKNGDKVRTSSGVRMRGGVDDKDTGNKSVANDVIDDVAEIFANYSKVINPDDIVENNEVVTEEESEQLWQQFEGELDSFFSLVNQSSLDSYV